MLVLGVYLLDKPNLAAEISAELARSEQWHVDQRWVALGRSPVPDALAAVTAWSTDRPTPKFELLNRLLVVSGPDPDLYDQVVVTDDDIDLPRGFLDDYLSLVEQYDLALSQPARTHDSYVDHRFVEALDGLEARQTRFVEIGPLFSMRRDALPHLTPFDVSSPMGWGYDFVWPVVLEAVGLHLGIIDATPVRHRLRPPVVNYSYEDAHRDMQAYLAQRSHLTPEAAFTIVRAFARSQA